MSSDLGHRAAFEVNQPVAATSRASRGPCIHLPRHSQRLIHAVAASRALHSPCDFATTSLRYTMVPCCSFQGAALPLRRAQPTERRLAIGLLQLPGRCTALAPRQAGRGAAPQHHRNFQGVALPLHHEPAIPHRLGRPHRNFQGVAQPLHPAHCIVGCGEAHGVAASRAPRSPHASLIGTKKTRQNPRSQLPRRRAALTPSDSRTSSRRSPDRSFQGAELPLRHARSAACLGPH